MTFCPDKRLCFSAAKSHPKLLRGWLRDTGYPVCHYLPLFATIQDCSPLFALFVLFAIRVFQTPVSELSGPKTIALTPFSFRLDTWSSIKEIEGKITRQTVSTTSLSPCWKRSYTKCGMLNFFSTSSRWSPSTTEYSAFIHFDFFETKLLEQARCFSLPLCCV